MRYAPVAPLQVVGIGLIVAYAAGNDDYYGGGVSRWEHASRADVTLMVVIGVAVASAIAGAFVVHVLFRSRRAIGPFTFLSMIALYCVSIGYAWFFLTGGH